jgi:serine/threonine-protein kinase
MVLTTGVMAERYRLAEILGQGGMAVVHRAHDDLLDRDVALKVLRPAYAQDPAFVKRFRREARHAASLHHPHIVTIYDTGVDAATGNDFIVMQLVHGQDLDRIMERERPLPIGFAVRVGIETAQALAFAHGQGLIHRDIKPGNLLIDRDGEVRVADFGIARAATDAGATTSGTMIGSAQYASPEQVIGDPVGPAADLYSLGVVLYEALTGIRPFDGPSPAAVALERLRIKPPPITAIDPTLPRPLEQIVMRLLERDPRLRPASAADLAAELEAFRAKDLGGIRRPGVRPREGAWNATALSTRAPAGRVGAEPGRRDRKRAIILPAGLAGALAALVLLVGGTVGAIAMLGDSGARVGGVLGQTSAPSQFSGGVAAAPVASNVAGPTPVPTPVTTSTPRPTTSPAPTLEPTARPTARPTAKPTVRPTQRPSGGGPARDPAETVDRFYRLVETHDYEKAAALWSSRMRAAYPPDGYIAGRFDDTTRIDVHRLQIQRLSVANREAVVWMDIAEYRTSGPARHWVGTWDLILVDGRWLMDDPHLSAA